MGERVTVELLGPLAASRGGQPVTLGGRRPRSVLAVLALRAGEVVSVDTLIEHLWGDEPPGDPVNSLQVHVSALRRVLEPGRKGGSEPQLLRNRPPGYLLDVEDDAVDVVRFEALARRGQDRLRVGEHAEAVALLGDALALWRGPLLADLADERFVAPEAARLGELRLSVIEAKHDAELALGRHREILPELERLVEEHPLREQIWAQLLLALYRSGRQADALRAYQRVREVLLDELGVDPGPELRALEQAILEHDTKLTFGVVPPAPEPASSSPTRAVSAQPIARLTVRVHGRETEIAQLVDLLREHPAVTLAGPGGCGKTTIALSVAAALEPFFRDGVHIVDLGGLDPDDDVAGVVAAGIGLPEVAADPIDGLVTRLAGSGLLLVLDTCERVAHPVATLANRLAAACPDVRVLTVSRRVLGTRGEQVFAVEGLATPRTDIRDTTAIAESPAVKAFLDRAVAVAPGFRLDDESAPVVAELARRLDGLPLALELAASRLRSLGVTDLLARLESALASAESVDADTEDRHRTIRATLDWSFELLRPEDAALLLALSMFSGPFDLAGAEAIGQGSILDALGRLIDHSLVVVDRAHGRARYHLLATVRDYARKRLRAGEADAAGLADRHAGYVRSVVDAADAGRPEWVERVGAVSAEIGPALTHLLENRPAEALDLTATLGTYWLRRGDLRDGRRWLSAALAAAPSDAADERRAAASSATGAIAFEQGDYAAARTGAAQAAEVWAGLGDPRALAEAECLLARVARAEGDLATARDLAERALNQFRAAGDLEGTAAAARELGRICRAEGDHESAGRLLREAVELFEAGRAGEPSRPVGAALAWGPSEVLVDLGREAGGAGEHARAERLLGESLGQAAERGNQVGLASCLQAMASLALDRGDGERAATLLGASEGLRAATGALPPPDERRDREALADVLAGRLGAARAAELTAAGRTLDFDAAIAAARA